MARTRIKFCGIRTPATLEYALSLGIDAVGFVAAPGSPRSLQPTQIVDLIRCYKPNQVLGVVLMVNPEREEVEELWRTATPDLIQFHGDEKPEFCDALGIPYIKALRVGGPVLPEVPPRIYRHAYAFLYDTYSEHKSGGTGKTFDWGTLPQGAMDKGVLAGGLTPQNVGDAIRQLRPCAVDVSSGIERAPGEKCEQLMEAFVQAVHVADREINET